MFPLCSGWAKERLHDMVEEPNSYPNICDDGYPDPERTQRKDESRSERRYKARNASAPPDTWDGVSISTPSARPSRHTGYCVRPVHGCFWHRHPDPNCPLSRMPKSRLEFWKPKLEGNRERDVKNIDELERLGWKVIIVWECQIRDLDNLRTQIRGFLR